MKDTKNKKIEIRVTAKEFHKLKLRADLYSEGNISKLIRYWINKAPLQFLPRTKTDEQLREKKRKTNKKTKNLGRNI